MKKILRTMMEENNRISRMLSSGGQALETDIVVYLRGSSASEYQQELVRRDILQMMLDGEARGDSMEEVLGDGKSFCDALLAELPPPTFREKALGKAGAAGLYLGILSAIWSVTALVQALVEKSWPYLPVSLGSVLNCVFIPTAAWALVLYICRTSFAKDHSAKGVSAGRKALLLFLAALVVCMLCGVLLRGVVLFSIHAVWAPVLIAALFGLHAICEYRLDRLYAAQSQ